MKYRLRYGVGVSAPVVAAELERIHADVGITPAHVVEAARPEEAPLHAAFTWDDQKAAELYRLDEARNLIRAVHVIDEATGKDHGSAFALVKAGTADAVYLPIAEVVSDPDLFSSAVQNLTQTLWHAQKALKDLEAEAARAGDDKRQGVFQRVNQHVERARDALQKAL